MVYPYFRFVEEQVALPWQRVCLAAATEVLESPKLAAVEQGLCRSQTTAERAYRQLQKRLPRHRSRRGSLHEPGIVHSSVRDFQMCEAYFWLSFLEDSLTCIEDELVPVCVMVLTGIGVSWELVYEGNQILMEQLAADLDAEQREIMAPYAERYLQAFSSKEADYRQAYRQGAASTTPGTLSEEDILNHLSRQVKQAPLPLNGPSQSSSPPSPEVMRLQQKLEQLEQQMQKNREQLDETDPPA